MITAYSACNNVLKNFGSGQIKNALIKNFDLVTYIS